MSYNRLSGIQAYIIRTATTHNVNSNPTTLRVHHARNAKSATYMRLYRLGLIVAPHEYADLTDLGADAKAQLDKDNNDTRVLTGRAGGPAHIVPQPAEPKPEQPERYRAVETRDGFAVEDRTDGTYVADGFNSRYPARLEAERLNLAADPITEADLAERTDVVYASREASAALMDRIRKLASADSEVAAWAKAGRIQRTNADAGSKVKFLACIAALWPVGTTVRGIDTEGVRRTGTVNSSMAQYVTNTAHPNFGRAYVDVTWDEIPGQWAITRNHPFVDTLTRI